MIDEQLLPASYSFDIGHKAKQNSQKCHKRGTSICNYLTRFLEMLLLLNTDVLFYFICSLKELSDGTMLRTALPQITSSPLSKYTCTCRNVATLVGTGWYSLPNQHSGISDPVDQYRNETLGHFVHNNRSSGNYFALERNFREITLNSS